MTDMKARTYLGLLGIGAAVTVYGEVDNFGRRKYGDRVLALRGICDLSGYLVCDHLWIDQWPFFAVIPLLKLGDIVRFSGTVDLYRREDDTHDWGLTDPKDIVLFLPASERGKREHEIRDAY